MLVPCWQMVPAYQAIQPSSSLYPCMVCQPSRDARCARIPRHNTHRGAESSSRLRIDLAISIFLARDLDQFPDHGVGLERSRVPPVGGGVVGECSTIRECRQLAPWACACRLKHTRTFGNGMGADRRKPQAPGSIRDVGDDRRRNEPKRFVGHIRGWGRGGAQPPRGQGGAPPKTRPMTHPLLIRWPPPGGSHPLATIRWWPTDRAGQKYRSRSISMTHLNPSAPTLMHSNSVKIFCCRSSSLI